MKALRLLVFASLCITATACENGPSSSAAPTVEPTQAAAVACTLTRRDFTMRNTGASCAYYEASPNPCCGTSTDRPPNTCPSSSGWNYIGGERITHDARCNELNRTPVP